VDELALPILLSIGIVPTEVERIELQVKACREHEPRREDLVVL
jgi:hypothetical protein